MSKIKEFSDRRQYPAELPNLANRLDWLVRRLRTESYIELQPEDIWVHDEIRRIVDELWRLNQDELVAEVLASLKPHPHHLKEK